MTTSTPIQDLIIHDFNANLKELQSDPELINRYMLELSIYRTFIIKQSLLEDFKEFEHTFTIENNINKNG